LKRDHRLLGRLFVLFAVLVALLGLPSAARAQQDELYTFTVSVLGGLGGSVDAEPGDSFSNTGLQLNLTMVTEPQTHVGFRFGQLALDDDEFFGSLTDADLTYVTLGGEYRFSEGFYDSGVYVGLGGYRLEGTSFSGEDEEDTALGLTIGVTGEFPVNRWLAVLVELSGHYADLEEAQIFAMGHAGLAIHF
jgi:hypothetical protein